MWLEATPLPKHKATRVAALGNVIHSTCLMVPIMRSPPKSSDQRAEPQGNKKKLYSDFFPVNVEAPPPVTSLWPPSRRKCDDFKSDFTTRRSRLEYCRWSHLLVTACLYLVYLNGGPRVIVSVLSSLPDRRGPHGSLRGAIFQRAEPISDVNINSGVSVPSAEGLAETDAPHRAQSAPESTKEPPVR